WCPARLRFCRATAGVFSAGTIGFLFWQSREAALAALEAFESAAGPLLQWPSAAKRPLPLDVDVGQELNSYYDRKSSSFFHSPPSGGPIYTGASTDCVAHEVGHAILTALNDSKSRKTLLRLTPNLSKANFLEAVLEDLANSVKRKHGATNPSAAPRPAF